MVDSWEAVTCLVDRSRRVLYEHVRRQRRPVNREEAAEATGMSRNLAAFHLDKLVDAGLLRARYEAPADRPRRRGRSPKVYEPAGTDVALTVPERRYQLVAEILADAVGEAPRDAGRAARELARRRGRECGARAAGAELVELLAALGFEPEPATGVVVLRNCPFHALAARQRELVCGLNLAFVTGLLAGAGDRGHTARLAPRPGACCVELVDEPPTGSVAGERPASGRASGEGGSDGPAVSR